MTTTNDNLIPILKLAGLNETEAKIYLACLQLGPSSVWNISLKIGIKRPTCYAVLDNLVADGVASKTNDGTRTIFSVVEPEKLLMTIDSRKNEFRASLPLFEGLKSESTAKPKIRVYEGLEGVRQAYMLGLDQPEGSEILVLGSAKIWYQYKDANQSYIAERVSRNIGLRVLFAGTEDNHIFTKLDRLEMRDTRFLPQKYFDPKVETQIFGNTIVYIAHSEKEPFATVIENEAIASDECQKFEILWQVSKMR